jgi:hypothetical protein
MSLDLDSTKVFIYFFIQVEIAYSYEEDGGYRVSYRP